MKKYLLCFMLFLISGCASWNPMDWFSSNKIEEKQPEKIVSDNFLWQSAVEKTAFMTNVNAETPIMGNGSNNAQRIINIGGLNHDDMSKFKEPGIICQELHQPISRNPILSDISLICYPNPIMTESPGTPVTRLVLEGRISGKTYFWPININLKGNGIKGNCIYTYDIHISRPGTSDPDIPVELGEGELIMEVERWNEMEDYGVYF